MKEDTQKEVMNTLDKKNVAVFFEHYDIVMWHYKRIYTDYDNVDEKETGFVITLTFIKKETSSLFSADEIEFVYELIDNDIERGWYLKTGECEESYDELLALFYDNDVFELDDDLGHAGFKESVLEFAKSKNIDYFIGISELIKRRLK